MLLTARDIINKRKILWEETHDVSIDKEFVESIADRLVSKSEGIALRKEIVLNPELLVEMCFTIVDKKLQTVPFFLNTVQQIFCNQLTKAIEEYDKGSRLSLQFMVLKGRQQGFTSFISAYQLALTITRKNFSGMTLADSAENAETIFQEKGKFIHDRLPENLRPFEKFNTRKELFFEGLNSKWRVASATKDIGRSKMLSFFHGSEAAYWVDIRSIFNGLGQALIAGAIQILESTANGIDEFKEFWDEDNHWQNCFFEWWLSPEYATSFQSAFAKKQFKANIGKAKDKSWESATDDAWVYYRCKWLMKNKNLKIEQVFWYYQKWREIKGDIRQEFPCFPEEAFIASGDCVYKNVEAIIERINLLKDYQKDNPPKIGYFEIKWQDPSAFYKIIDFKWVDDPDGYIRMYDQPIDSVPYVIGGDTKGAGLGIVANRDFYSASVKNNENGQRCAVLHSKKILPDEYAAQMYCLGKFYNTALIAIEVNIDRYPTFKLNELGYPNQYIRRAEDTYTGTVKKSFGWRTDGNNRPKIISKHIVYVNYCVDSFTDVAMLKEFLTFVKNETRYDHQKGKHDDLLFADMIAEEVSIYCSHEGFTTPDKKKEKLFKQLGLHKVSQRREVLR